MKLSPTYHPPVPPRKRHNKEKMSNNKEGESKMANTKGRQRQKRLLEKEILLAMQKSELSFWDTLEVLKSTEENLKIIGLSKLLTIKAQDVIPKEESACTK